MFWQMVTVEYSKITKRAILWIELALLALAVLLLHGLLYATLRLSPSEEMPPEAVAQIEETLTWPAGLAGAMSFAAGPNLGGLIIIILVGAVVAQEYGWRTIQLWLGRGVSRPLFLLAKFVALLLPALLIVLTPLLVGGLITAFFSQQMNGAIPFDQVNWGQLGFSVLRVTYTLLPYAALTFFLAIASRSTVVAVGGGLGYALLLEGILVQLLAFAGGAWARIGYYLPAGLARGLLATNSGLVVQVEGASAPAAQYLEPGPAALGIALYALAFLGLSILVFRRQDLGG
ncbi:MAG: ABC transporter permease [Chloroflexi bacterium]|nr:ABC transporter permease [Chloroflexota bacterium]MCI0579285.1 ABC transporter permease [Chloroflexota bacterium]MCI0644355.1 ABC transporter permease [Chloroflexota bacterium]MCI0728028.1 ABC transporter permease [Chloroflexota bacterium]